MLFILWETFPITKAAIPVCGIPDYPVGLDHLVPENLQERDLLHFPPCRGASEQALCGSVHDSYLLSRAGKLPFTFHGRMERRSPGPAPGPDSFGKNPAYAYDFPAAILGDDRQRFLTGHQQPAGTENPLCRQQPRPPEYLFGSPRTV